MKKFFSEFKKFISRGNIVDMAVGVIVGSSFTAIVNGLSNNILKPIINWLLTIVFGANSLSEVYTVLTPVYNSEGVLDLTQSIYIDWGAFINSIINFLIVATVLFCIVKAINLIRDRHDAFIQSLATGIPTSADRKAMKKLGIKWNDQEAVKTYMDEKAKKLEDEKRAAEEKARLEKEANPTAEQLLKEIRDLMKNGNFVN